MTIIEQIANLELVKVRFRLEILEPFSFDPGMILHWRKELVRGARLALESGLDDSTAFAELLNPLPADDPVAQKRFQKPAPPFIIDPENLLAADYAAGEILSLDVLFPGDGVRHAITFARVLVGLGRIGLHKGSGQFELCAMDALTHNDDWQSVWQQGGSLENISLPLLKAGWLIEEKPINAQPLSLRFVTPARLLKNNRPLFTAEFRDLFPFILRRVTSVLYLCSRIELQSDVSSLLADAAEVCTQTSSLAWVDWRHLDTNHGIQGIGGLSGTISLISGLTDDLHTILRLAEMFHVGKWASYGTGCFVMEPVMAETVEKR